MGRLNVGVVLDLVPATEAADHNLGVAAVAHGWEKSLLTHGPGCFVMLDFMPEAAGHAAAAAVDLRCPSMSGHRQQVHGGIRAHEGLLMTMTVEQDRRSRRPHRQGMGFPFQKFSEQRFHHLDVSRHQSGIEIAKQSRRFVKEG